MCGIWADWPAITPKPFLKSQTIKFVSHLVPPGGRAHHSEAASLLHLHNLRLHRVDAEGGGDPHQEQTGEQKFHFVGRNISLFGQTEFVKTMPVVWCRCNLSIWNKEKPLTIVFLNFDQRKNKIWIINCENWTTQATLHQSLFRPQVTGRDLHLETWFSSQNLDRIWWNRLYYNCQKWLTRKSDQIITLFLQISGAVTSWCVC